MHVGIRYTVWLRADLDIGYVREMYGYNTYSVIRLHAD